MKIQQHPVLLAVLTVVLLDDVVDRYLLPFRKCDENSSEAFASVDNPHFREVNVVAADNIPETAVKLLDVVYPLELCILPINLLPEFFDESRVVPVFEVLEVGLCQCDFEPDSSVTLPCFSQRLF